jgi:uncharacterized protein YigE (DUF2233 family)
MRFGCIITFPFPASFFTTLRVSFLYVLALGSLPADSAVEEESVTYSGVKFRVVRAEPAQVRLVWKNAAGEIYRTFDRVLASHAAAGKSVRFLMNAGIFEPGGIPSGLHVEQGKILHPLNLADAPGNFFLKPNGVIWIENGKPDRAFIATSESFAARLKTSPAAVQTAVQSGPMLLIQGVRHPAFQENSPNKLHRNGVGVNGRNTLVFAITDRGESVNLWDFAGLFLHLGCKNALFLDGDISQMAVNPAQPVESNQFGAMFFITD